MCLEKRKFSFTNTLVATESVEMIEKFVVQNDLRQYSTTFGPLVER